MKALLTMVAASMFIVNTAVAQESKPWAAIATGEKTIAYGFAADKATREEAERIAMRICRSNIAQEAKRHNGKKPAMFGDCILREATNEGLAAYACYFDGKLKRIQYVSGKGQEDAGVRAVAEGKKNCVGGARRVNF